MKTLSNANLFKLTIPGDPTYIRLAKKTASSAGSLLNFDMEAISDIEIAVGEACKLVTCHNSDGWCDSYDITWELDGERIVITVAEGEEGRRNGKGGKRPCIDCPKEGDLGIAVMKTLMDEVQIVSAERGNKYIRMTKVR